MIRKGREGEGSISIEIGLLNESYVKYKSKTNSTKINFLNNGSWSTVKQSMLNALQYNDLFMCVLQDLLSTFSELSRNIFIRLSFNDRYTRCRIVSKRQFVLLIFTFVRYKLSKGWGKSKH